MSYRKIEQVKEDRGFKLFDIIIYGAVLLAVAVMFIVLFTTRDGSALSGVRITVRGETVFEYAFGGNAVYSEGLDVKEDGDGITVTLLSDGDKNVVYVDKGKKTVKMIEANCKGKECMYFAPMSDNSDFIYCSPHGVKVEPLDKDLDDPNIKI